MGDAMWTDWMGARWGNGAEIRDRQTQTSDGLALAMHKSGVMTALQESTGIDEVLVSARV